MHIGKKFNELTLEEYFFFIDHHKKYSDFNTLGLYRSIVEHELLTLEEKITLREYAHKKFRKTFDFLQLKDPKTFVEVECLGLELTKGDERHIWEEVRKNQQKILSDKKIKHRNFGDYSKHNCGYSDCIYDGMMIRQGSPVAECSMHFNSDKRKNELNSKLGKQKSERKNKHNIIRGALDNE